MKSVELGEGDVSPRFSDVGDNGIDNEVMMDLSGVLCIYLATSNAGKNLNRGDEQKGREVLARFSDFANKGSDEVVFNLSGARRIHLTTSDTGEKMKRGDELKEGNVLARFLNFSEDGWDGEVVSNFFGILRVRLISVSGTKRVFTHNLDSRSNKRVFGDITSSITDSKTFPADT